MTDTDLMYHVLELTPPWRILQIRDDLRARQIDVWVGIEAPKRTWIFGRKPPPEQASEYVWRHLNLGAMRCVIHAALPHHANTENLPWCGKADMPFTSALALEIATLFSHGISLQRVCALLDIPVEDMWKFRHRLDSGQVGLSSGGSPAATATANAVRPQGGQNAVPEPDDPVWEGLLDGSTNIDIRVLGLKLLLAKMREQMQSITDREVRMLKSYELQRYFARNQKQVAYELAQLRPH